MADIEPYEDSDGIHWPDAIAGSELYYGIGLTRFLAEENDTLVDVAWEVPTGLTEMDAYIVSDEARIKLSHDRAGTYEVVLTFNTTESGDTQKFKQVMMLIVT